MDKENSEMRDVNIDGYQINYEDESKEAIYFLERNLSSREVKTIFGYAKFKRESFFQDREGRSYQVKYDGDEFYLKRL